jgi:hypothetical protein
VGAITDIPDVEALVNRMISEYQSASASYFNRLKEANFKI